MKQQEIIQFIEDVRKNILPEDFTVTASEMKWEGKDGILMEVYKHYEEHTPEYSDWRHGQPCAGAFIEIDGNIALQIDYEDWEFNEEYTTSSIEEQIKWAIEYV